MFYTTLKILFILIYVQKSSGFKAAFDYYKPLYLNSSSFHLSISFDASQMETSSTNFINTCTTVLDEMESLKLQTENLEITSSSSKVFVQSQRLSFDEGSTSCAALAQDCQLSDFTNYTATIQAPDVMQENTRQPYLDYKTNQLGQLVRSTGQIVVNDNLLDQTIILHSCKPPFELHGTLCLAFGSPAGLNVHEASRFCRK